MSAQEVGMFVLDLVAFVLLCGLCAAGLYWIGECCKEYLEERREAQRRPQEPTLDKEAQAVAAAADLAGQQAEMKTRAWFALQDELRQLRDARYDR